MPIFRLKQASNTDRDEPIEINTLEELLDLIRAQPHMSRSIILEQERDLDTNEYLESFELTLYDDWVE